ncbi:hypothetical protein I302_107538 [Kwoniella bestiolae CBS 10118]|uniref:Uncharacterized protein n=1 Tax=Kwoniella bestiolae CBS 10118 TaxID=1296100 RepID=A0A1B9FY88_9TREE|nr:hypothetical protein I302_06721 [Kwoniella bestiolae CBS 10118]OCF23737.1 hypothetical protein I302_06721 [Kwoniella bestiolae CBS 10118]
MTGSRDTNTNTGTNTITNLSRTDANNNARNNANDSSTTTRTITEQYAPHRTPQYEPGTVTEVSRTVQDTTTTSAVINIGEGQSHMTRPVVEGLYSIGEMTGLGTCAECGVGIVYPAFKCVACLGLTGFSIATVVRTAQYGCPPW